MIVTFYSFKGGVGRSMALVNVGEILADWGYRVILCDWDLEAPGLERYLVDAQRANGDQPPEIATLLSRDGVMDLLGEYKETLAKPPSIPEGSKLSEDLSKTHAIVGNILLRKPSGCAVPVSTGRKREGRGALSLLTAGRRDGEASFRYAEAVRTFDWDEFYEKWAGDAYIDFFRLDLTGEPRQEPAGAADLVLVDSRTGVTEQGGVCTHHLADLVVLISAANDLNLDGTRWMAQALSEPRLKEVRDGRPLQVLPVASRIEQTAQKEELVTFRRRFRREFRSYVPLLLGKPEDFLLTSEIPYMPFYSFKERVVAREPEEEREEKLYGAYLALADGIVRCGISSGLLAEPAFRGRPHRAAPLLSPDRMERPKGLIHLAYAPADRKTAETLARGLSAVGVRVWADFLGTGGPVPEGTTGSLLVIGSDAGHPTLRAEIDYVLKRQALQPEFHIVPVLQPGLDLKDLRTVVERLYPILLPSHLTWDDSELFGNLAAELAGTDGTVVVVDQEVCPFRGLRAFEESQARFFFGREAEARELAQKMGRTSAGTARWLQIEGPSGVGKSSLAMAGLVPAARLGWIPGTGHEWTVLVCRPGIDPILALTTALDRPGGPPASEIQARLQSANTALRDIVREIAPAGGQVLLVLDQLEELFMLSGGPEAPACRQQVDELLATALEDPHLPFFLITTVRSDFLADLELLPRLGTLLQQRALRYNLAPLSQPALRTVMTAPARLAGLVSESGLPERILRDLQRGGRATPALLGLLLARLWETRSGNLLTHEAYDRLGEVDGVLFETADRLIESLSPEEQKQARAMVLRLVSTQRARLGVPRADVLAAGGNGPDTARVLHALATSQIVTVGGERVELAHDSLISSWPRLEQWMEAEREALKRREELEAAALAWEAAGKPEAGLPGGTLLTYFAAAAPADRRAGHFLDAARDFESRQLQKTRRRRKVEWGVAAALAVILAIAGAVEWYRESRKTQSRELAVRAIQVSERKPVESLLLAIEAGELADTGSAKTALRQAIAAARERAVLPHDSGVFLASFSPDGQRVLTAALDQAVLWDATTGQIESRLQADLLLNAAFSPDGRSILTLSGDGFAGIWDIATGKPAMEVAVFEPAAGMDFRLEGNWPLWLRTDTSSNKIIPAALTEFLVDQAVTSLAVSPDGKQAVLGSSEGLLSLWDISSGISRRQIARTKVAEDSILYVGFSGNGRMIGAASNDGTVLLWDTDSGGSGLRALKGHEGPVWLASFSPNGKQLVTVSDDKTARLWDVETGYALAVLRGHEGAVQKAAFSPDGLRVATASTDGTARIWEVATGKEVAILRGHRSEVVDIQISPDGQLALTASSDRTARIWDLGTPGDVEAASLPDLLLKAQERIPVTLTPEERARLVAAPIK
jgi:WD40 repeat protein